METQPERALIPDLTGETVGNAEQMLDPKTDMPHTSYTIYDVPLFVIGERFKAGDLARGGRLADIAPTALAMMGVDQPEEMTGRSLVGTP